MNSLERMTGRLRGEARSADGRAARGHRGPVCQLRLVDLEEVVLSPRQCGFHCGQLQKARMCLPSAPGLIRSFLGQDVVPAFSVRTPNELVGFRSITCAQSDGVPLQLLPCPIGHVAEVVRLRDPARKEEI